MVLYVWEKSMQKGLFNKGGMLDLTLKRWKSVQEGSSMCSTISLKFHSHHAWTSWSLNVMELGRVERRIQVEDAFETIMRCL